MTDSVRQIFHDLNNALGAVILNLEELNDPACNAATRKDAAADALAEARGLAAALVELRLLVTPATGGAQLPTTSAPESGEAPGCAAPVAAGERSAPVITGSETAELGLAIVIIDDDDAQRRAVCRLLDSKLYQIIEAGDGATGLERAHACRPEIVLLDVQMPGLDGYEVCRRLRADPLTAETVIVMMTALADQESRQRGIAAGADDFLTKPVDGLELKMRIANIIRLSRYRRLVRERAKFEWLADQADAGYLLLAVSNTITYANRRAREYLGIAPDSAGDLPDLFASIAATYMRKPEEAWANWPEPGDSPRFLLRPETAQHRALWLEVKVKPLPESGSLERLVQLSDVTGLMETRRLRGTFALQVSHKLRTPLTALSGGLALLDKLGTDLPLERAAAIIDMVRRGGKRLQDAILEVLEYLDAPVRGTGGHVLMGEELEGLINAAAADAAVAVETAIPPELRPMQHILSREAMETILRELFTNAKKFHPRHAPKMSVTLCHLPDGSACRILVKDDGPGIPVEELQKVLTPYYQYEKHDTGEVGGMGLGLSLIASLVWSVGGNLRLHAVADGSGLEVELILPMAGGRGK